MSVIAFIPARGGSKSIPGKNIKNFCGKPLIYWNLFALEKSELVDELLLLQILKRYLKKLKNSTFQKLNCIKEVLKMHRIILLLSLLC